LFGAESGFFDEMTHSKDWAMFKDYCVRDVEVERKLWFKMLPLGFPDDMWKDWFLDQRMNEFGLPVNVPRAKKLLGFALRYKEWITAEMKRLTGLENPNSPEQLLGWVTPRGYTWGSLNKSFVDLELANSESKLTPEAREVLRMRRIAAANSWTKLQTLIDQVSPDGFLRHQFMFMGAARTGRWSSAGVQVQNLPRPIKQIEKAMSDDPEKYPLHLFDLIDREAYDETFKEFKGQILPFVASCIRMMFEVPLEL